MKKSRNKNFDGSNSELSNEDYKVDDITIRITKTPDGKQTINIYPKNTLVIALTIICDKAEVWDYWGWGQG